MNMQDVLTCGQEHFSRYQNTAFLHEESAPDDTELPCVDVIPNDMMTDQELEKA